MRMACILLTLVGCATVDATTAHDPATTDATLASALVDPSQTATATETDTTAPKPACTSAEHHAFDFWIGRWEVRNAEGAIVGHNTIEAIFGGCALREAWSGTSGSRGTSLNLYDASRGRWHQTWVDNAGGLLVLEGGLDGERMVLGGETHKEDGQILRHEIAWTPLADGRVEQHWRASDDGGERWTDVFVGFYTREDES